MTPPRQALRQPTAGTSSAAGVPAATATEITARQLLPLVIPAIVVGVVSAALLFGAERFAKVVEDVIWTTIPDALGVSSSGPGWIFLVLTLAGLVIGLVVRYVPGHAGPDPATLELVAEPLPLRVLPGLAVALVLMLAGGVAWGPENPIIGINVGSRGRPRDAFLPDEAPIWLVMAVAGTIGAMFGTPVAAALLFSELDPGTVASRCGTGCSRRWSRRQRGP